MGRVLVRMRTNSTAETPVSVNIELNEHKRLSRYSRRERLAYLFLRIVPLFVVAVLLLANAAKSEEGNGAGRSGRPFRMKPSYTRPLGLLTHQSVRNEIGLDSQQLKSVQGLYSQYVSDGRAELAKIGLGDATLGSLSAEERSMKLHNSRAGIDEIRDRLEATYDRKLAGVLREDQHRRLEQISAQRRFEYLGGEILWTPGMADSLGIGNAQKERILAVMEAVGRGLDRDERLRRFSELQKERNAKLLQVLTPEQRAKLEKMKGAPFDLSTLGKPDDLGLPATD